MQGIVIFQNTVQRGNGGGKRKRISREYTRECKARKEEQREQGKFGRAGTEKGKSCMSSSLDGALISIMVLQAVGECIQSVHLVFKGLFSPAGTLEALLLRSSCGACDLDFHFLRFSFALSLLTRIQKRVFVFQALPGDGMCSGDRPSVLTGRKLRDRMLLLPSAVSFSGFPLQWDVMCFWSVSSVC